ncbi:circadian-associated transcriptional repressor [Osmerus eperlanus]|uniref:circadian-associated transcriptional repressor n=1 Tax=Osmerus eperlanus TaxID=29151 RepID=UPI002E1205F3
MSASDSDNSIDWLASDDEENESEPEPNCTKRSAQKQAPLSPSYHPEGSGSGSSPGFSAVSCTEILGSHESSLFHTGCPEESKFRKTQPPQKRPHSPMVTKHCGKDRQLTSNQSEEDWLFTNKCRELQCYIQPLSSILKGLRTGRYRERLSSFQESVAMDRIQRIMGVLQKPCMGERYMNIILKMEEMLKNWFPNVQPRDQHTFIQTEEITPAKKDKLSSSTTSLPSAVASPVTDLTPPGTYSVSNLKWLHTSPICSPKAEHGGGLRHLQFSRALTQDSAVSSSTDSHAKMDSVPSRLPLPKINAPCLERLLKSRESIIGRKGAEDRTGSSWS